MQINSTLHVSRNANLLVQMIAATRHSLEIKCSSDERGQ